jgi:hypothetical protein
MCVCACIYIKAHMNDEMGMVPQDVCVCVCVCVYIYIYIGYTGYMHDEMRTVMQVGLVI